MVDVVTAVNGIIQNSAYRSGIPITTIFCRFTSTFQSQCKWDTLFDATKERFDKKLIGESTLAICLSEIPQKFSLKAISDEEFDEEIGLHQYGRYVGHHVGIGACQENLSKK